MKLKTLCCLALLALVATFAGAQSGADLSAYENALVGNVEQEILYNAQQLAALADATRGVNAELADVIADATWVEARMVNLDAGHSENVREIMTSTVDQLSSNGWAPLVSVRANDDQVEVLLRHTEGRIQGLVALFADGEEEAGFANLAGDLDMAQVMALAKNAEALAGFLDILREESEG